MIMRALSLPQSKNGSWFLLSRKGRITGQSLPLPFSLAFETRNLNPSFQIVEVRRKDIIIQPYHGITTTVTYGRMVIHPAYPGVPIQTI
jgi:hypothetical protein